MFGFYLFSVMLFNVVVFFVVVIFLFGEYMNMVEGFSYIYIISFRLVF